MPLGYYLAQGLVPLGSSSSDDEEGPCELPDGRVVCGRHGLVYCARCCVDYSFMSCNNSEDEDEEEDESENKDPGDDSSGSKHQTAGLGTITHPHGFQISGLGPTTASGDASPAQPGKEGPPAAYPLFASPELRRYLNSIGDNFPTEGFESMMGPQLRRGTGRVFPTKFVPPSTSVTPLELFSGRKSHLHVTRYTLPNDTGKVLIHADGACLNNGQENPKAGWAFWHGFNSSGKKLVDSARLDAKGPFGEVSVQTSNRAELRAIIGALRFRHWPGEGFHTIVFATDSEYVVEGSTKWAKTWVKHGWVRREGCPVKNKDLWKALLGEIERYKDDGMAVQFWRVPREWNTIADAAAKEAAAEEPAPSEWTEMMGMNI